MPTTTARRATAPPAAPPLDFEERLALAGLSTTDTPLNLADVIRTPVAVPQTPMAPRSTPVADLLQRARQLLVTDGWCRDAQRADDGRHCLYGAVRAAARGDGHAETTALGLVLDAIRKQFGGDSIPTFNDSCGDVGPVMRVLDGAADLAETRGI